MSCQKPVIPLQVLFRCLGQSVVACQSKNGPNTVILIVSGETATNKRRGLVNVNRLTCIQFEVLFLQPHGFHVQVVSLTPFPVHGVQLVDGGLIPSDQVSESFNLLNSAS